MLNLLRNLISPASEHEPQELVLTAGGYATFGKVPQKTLRGRRLKLTAAQTYVFDGESFVAYTIDTDGAHHQVVQSGAQPDNYLALSQQLNKGMFHLLFPDYMPEEWFDLEVGATLKATPTAFGDFSGWFASSYNMVMQTNGVLHDADGARAQIFDYVLLADNHNEFALEAERYADGTLRVFATVYRPASDIVRTEAAPTLVLVEREEEVTAVETETPDPLAIQAENIAEVATVSMEPAPAEEIQETPVQEVASIASFIAEEAAQKEQQVTLPETSQLLACNIELAGRIIDEAKRNAMGLEELIRKVIDLPAHIREEVWIPFHLSNEEYAILAERYGLAADAHADVRRHIMEELAQFAGVKKKK